MLEKKSPRVIILKIAEAESKDVGRAIARVDQKEFSKIGNLESLIIEKRLYYYKLLPLPIQIIKFQISYFTDSPPFPTIPTHTCLNEIYEF